MDRIRNECIRSAGRVNWGQSERGRTRDDLGMCRGGMRSKSGGECWG